MKELSYVEIKETIQIFIIYRTITNLSNFELFRLILALIFIFQSCYDIRRKTL